MPFGSRTAAQSWQLHPEIAFPDLIVEILANAWFPHSDFKLSCGSQDKIPQQLDTLALVVEAPVVQFKDPDKTRLRQAIAEPPNPTPQTGTQGFSDRHPRQHPPLGALRPSPVAG